VPKTDAQVKTVEDFLEDIVPGSKTEPFLAEIRNRYITRKKLELESLIKQAELRGRIDEWLALGDCLTEYDKTCLSRNFLDFYRVHGEWLQQQLKDLESTGHTTNN
jgi:hypothetical protein